MSDLVGVNPLVERALPSAQSDSGTSAWSRTRLTSRPREGLAVAHGHLIGAARSPEHVTVMRHQQHPSGWLSHGSIWILVQRFVLAQGKESDGCQGSDNGQNVVDVQALLQDHNADDNRGRHY